MWPLSLEIQLCALDNISFGVEKLGRAGLCICYSHRCTIKNWCLQWKDNREGKVNVDKMTYLFSICSLLSFLYLACIMSHMNSLALWLEGSEGSGQHLSKGVHDMDSIQHARICSCVKSRRCASHTNIVFSLLDCRSKG